MSAPGFPETATDPSGLEAGHVFSQGPLALAGICRARHHAPKGTTCPNLSVHCGCSFSAAQTFVSEVHSHRAPWRHKIVSLASRYTQPVPPKRRELVLHRAFCIFSFASKSHHLGPCTECVAQGDTFMEIWLLEIQQPFLICEFMNCLQGRKRFFQSKMK